MTDDDKLDDKLSDVWDEQQKKVEISLMLLGEK
jgi:hypothetical protein